MVAWIGDGARRGVLFALGFAVVAVAILLPSSRFAERYTFSATYAVATVGAIVAYHAWPSMRAALEKWDARIPGLAIWLWLLLIVLRLTVGPLLPRIS